MRVGILTLKLHSNFGFLMQAYALQKTIIDLGHEPFHFYIKEEPVPMLKRIEVFVKKLIRNLFFGTNYKLFPYYPSSEDYAIKDKNTWVFIRDNLSLTPYIPLLETKKVTSIPQYDSYIVGSDQVWRREFTDDIRCYFFSFINDKSKRMSYAASFGSETLSYSKKALRECKSLLSKFDEVTVREDDGIRICKDYFNHDAIKVIDPTLLLRTEDYLKLIDDDEPLLNNNPYIFVYILRPTQEKNDFVNMFSREKGLGIVNIMPKKFEDVGRKHLQDCIFPSVSTWLNGFRNAEYVITDSFHASVFSIIFHKQFFVVNDIIGGITRIPSLLNSLGLQDRYAIKYHPGMKEIDYHKVDEHLLKQRKQSKSILIDFFNSQ